MAPESGGGSVACTTGGGVGVLGGLVSAESSHFILLKPSLCGIGLPARSILGVPSAFPLLSGCGNSS